jgi:ubiquitin-like 1-activating enzyme E1 A
VRLNDTCRSMGKKFYAGGIYGLLGYIFCDLQDHEFVSPYAFCRCCYFDGLIEMVSRDRSGKKDARNLKLRSRFTSLGEALKWPWNLKIKREAKEINPHLIFTLLGT